MKIILFIIISTYTLFYSTRMNLICRLTFTFIISVVFYSCTSSSQHDKINTSFPFDTILHYSIRISEDEMQAMLSKSIHQNDTFNQYQETIKSIVEGKFFTIKKPESILLLDSLNFQKHILSDSAFAPIYSILSHNYKVENPISKCIPKYQDFLFLKKQNELKAVIQICFSCKSILIESEIPEVKNEIRLEDYEILSQILENNK